MKLPRRLALCGLLLTVSAPIIASKAVFRQFPIPTPGSGPTSVLGTGFGVLFTEFNANKIGFLTSDGRMLEYTIPTPNSGPMDLDIANDGTGGVAVWFTEFLANKIGRLNPHTGEFREYAIPTPASGPHSIVAGSSEVWFTEFYGNKIGRLTAAGVFSEFEVPTGTSGPMGITRVSFPDTIWFTEFLANKLGYLPRAGGPIGELTIPTPNSGPTDIHFAGDGRAFFTEFNAGKVAYVDHDRRTIVETPVPTASSGPYRICKSLFANREVWFTERSANQIGVIRASGSITEYELPAGQAEPLGCSYGLDQTWFTQRTPNALGWVHHDTSVVVRAGTFDAWETTFSYANAEPTPTALFAGFYRDPPLGCAGSCPWQGNLDLPARGADSIAVPFPAGYALFSRSRDRGELPALRGRARYVPRPERASDLPAVRLSTINALDPQVLVFPGATGSASARSNLLLSNIWSNTSLFFSYETSLSVRIDVFSSEGALLGSETHGVVGGVFVDYLDRHGIRELANGQIRVTKTGGGGLLWGTLTTLDGDAVVTDVGRNLSLHDESTAIGDPLVVLGGAVGTWDTEIDVGNARAEPLAGTIEGLSCPAATDCARSPATFTVPANGTVTLRASELPGFPAGFTAYGLRFAGTGPAPTARARTVNRARPSQTAVLPALHRSAIRKLDGTALSFPGGAHSSSGARSNLVLAETGAGDAAVNVEVFAPNGSRLKSIAVPLARGQTAFLADVVGGGSGDIENAHVLVTKVGGEGTPWAILSTFDNSQALSVGWGIAP